MTSRVRQYDDPRLARIADTQKVRTRYKVTFRDGSDYVVITYPDSDLIRIETWARGRSVTETSSPRLHAAVRAALAELRS